MLHFTDCLLVLQFGFRSYVNLIYHSQFTLSSHHYCLCISTRATNKGSAEVFLLQQAAVQRVGFPGRLSAEGRQKFKAHPFPSPPLDTLRHFLTSFEIPLAQYPERLISRCT